MEQVNNRRDKMQGEDNTNTRKEEIDLYSQTTNKTRRAQENDEQRGSESG